MQTNLAFPPASHRTDPHTSRQAERAITESGKRAEQAEAVLALVMKHPGLTSAELSTRTDELQRQQIARRLPDLRSKGQVFNGNTRQCTVTRKSSVVWWPAS